MLHTNKDSPNRLLLRISLLARITGHSVSSHYQLDMGTRVDTHTHSEGGEGSGGTSHRSSELIGVLK